MQPSVTRANSAQPRDININIRAKKTQRDLIDQAAEMLGKSRSDFMLEIACREAEEVLLDQRVFNLDADKFKQFQALLDAPPGDNPKLRKLMSSKAPWEPGQSRYLPVDRGRSIKLDICRENRDVAEPDAIFRRPERPTP